MKSYVITIMDNPRSVEVATRCIESGKKFGVEVDYHPAFTPKNNPEQMMIDKGINYDRFKNNQYSRFEPCMAAFLSHRQCWKKAIELDEPVLVLEHDAVFTAPLPKVNIAFKVISFGKPSYGSYRASTKEGFFAAFSKPGGYLPGAHAYLVSPRGAKILVEKSYMLAEPTDIYLKKDNFPWLTEYYPWPVMADDSFSCIQLDEGCKAKHNYNKGIEII